MNRIANRYLLVALLIAGLTPHAFAVNKEMVQLQDEVQQLQDSVAKLQQFNQERMGAMSTLLQQTADSVTKMSATVESLQTTVRQQQDTQGGKVEQISGQIQSLNDSVDELKARLDKISKTLADVQNQTQSINSAVQHPDTTNVGAAAIQPGSQPVGAPPNTDATTPGKPSAAVPLDTNAAGAATQATGAAPADQLYQTAYGDFMAAKYNLAAAEFNDVIHFYPDNTYAGSAHFYLGEIAYKQGHYASAIKEYDIVIANFPGHNKIPGAELHKAFGMIASRQTAAGERELRTLIQRYPNSPEATAAHNKLNTLSR